MKLFDTRQGIYEHVTDSRSLTVAALLLQAKGSRGARPFLVNGRSHEHPPPSGRVVREQVQVDRPHHHRMV